MTDFTINTPVILAVLAAAAVLVFAFRAAGKTPRGAKGRGGGDGASPYAGDAGAGGDHGCGGDAGCGGDGGGGD